MRGKLKRLQVTENKVGQGPYTCLSCIFTAMKLYFYMSLSPDIHCHLQVKDINEDL